MFVVCVLIARGLAHGGIDRFEARLLGQQRIKWNIGFSEPIPKPYQLAFGRDAVAFKQITKPAHNGSGGHMQRIIHEPCRLHILMAHPQALGDFGDAAAIFRPVLRGYEEFTDLPENRSLPVYSLQEIATEKILALADRARNEPRDLYDLWHLTSNEGVELGALADAISQKLEFRSKPFDGLAEVIRLKEARLKSLWKNRLGYQMVMLPVFDEVFRAVQRTLRQANLP